MDVSRENDSVSATTDGSVGGGGPRQVEVFFGDTNNGDNTVNVGLNSGKGKGIDVAGDSDMTNVSANAGGGVAADLSNGAGGLGNIGIPNNNNGSGFNENNAGMISGGVADANNTGMISGGVASANNVGIVNTSGANTGDAGNASAVSINNSNVGANNVGISNSNNGATLLNDANGAIGSGPTVGGTDAERVGLNSNQQNINPIKSGNVGVDFGMYNNTNTGSASGGNLNPNTQSVNVASTFAMNTNIDTSPLTSPGEYNSNSTTGGQTDFEASEDDYSSFDAKFNQSVNNSVSEIFHKNNASVGSGSGDIVLGRGRKKKTGLIVGIIIAVVCVVVGVILFITLGLPAMDPKTGGGIKARNYEEAFNIYANYFLFGEESKKAVDWEATTGEDFASYFQRVTETPFDVEGVVTGQKTVGGEIKKMRDDYSVFRKMYLNLKEKSDTMVQFVNDYEQLIEFANEYYNVGLPSEFSVADKYVEGGYDAAQDFINQVATAYESVGVLYDYDVSALIGDYGYNKLSVIEIYNQVGCMDEDGVDYTCVSSKSDLGDTEYLWKAADEYSSIFSIKYNVENSIESAMFNIMSGLNLIQDSNTNDERKF